MYFIQDLLELVTFVTSIYLIISGYSDNEKYTSIEYVRKRNLIFGIILLILVLIVGLPAMYHGAIQGWEAGSKVK
jgi:hypothetical protein